MKYIVEVIADNSGQWVGNGLIFETKEAAETWGFGLAMRWTLVREYRTREVPDEPVELGPRVAHGVPALVRKLVTAALVLSLAMLPALARADSPPISMPGQLYAGFVTCIPNTNGGLGCLHDPAATTAQWRVVNAIGPFILGYESSADFLNATLTFDYTGGELVWTWDVIHPVTGVGTFVETTSFPVSLLSSFESLTFTATLSQTAFDPLFAGPSLCCLDGRRFTEAFFADATFSSGTTVFPPPLDLKVPGTFVDTLVLTPEPMTGLLVTLPMLLAGRRLFRGGVDGLQSTVCSRTDRPRSDVAG